MNVEDSTDLSFTLAERGTEPVSTEGIKFADFDSMKENWFLITRNAPSPDEREVIETVPYRQGTIDYAQANEERYFNARTISYTFMDFKHIYHDRKLVEQDLKRRLMPKFEQQILDSHDTDYYWIGKCHDVQVTDDAAFNSLQATISFTCYPFSKAINLEGADIWDDVYFPHYIFQNVKFDVNGTKNINIYNIGSDKIEPKMIIKGNINVISNEDSFNLKDGDYSSIGFVLNVGNNPIKLAGTGIIEFQIRREELI